jgi:hypothetical protein
VLGTFYLVSEQLADIQVATVPTITAITTTPIPTLVTLLLVVIK